VLFLSVFCTGAAFIIQAMAQQYTSASHVGVIFTLEPYSQDLLHFFWPAKYCSRAYVGAAL
jgi:hypothetical protein